MSRKKKNYYELKFTDDFMFWKVMESHLDLSQEVLELILNRKLEGIKIVQGQRTFKASYESKGIERFFPIFANRKANE